MASRKPTTKARHNEFVVEARHNEFVVGLWLFASLIMWATYHSWILRNKLQIPRTLRLPAVRIEAPRRSTPRAPARRRSTRPTPEAPRGRGRLRSRPLDPSQNRLPPLLALSMVVGPVSTLPTSSPSPPTIELTEKRTKP